MPGHDHGQLPQKVFEGKGEINAMLSPVSIKSPVFAKIIAQIERLQ